MVHTRFFKTVLMLGAVVVTGAGAAVEKKQLGNTIATVEMSRIASAPGRRSAAPP